MSNEISGCNKLAEECFILPFFLGVFENILADLSYFSI
jgi:hypothetical protein